MYSIKNEKEESFLMGFTDWTEFHKWNKGEKHPQALLLSCIDYMKIITQNSDKEGFVINPYGKEVLIRKKDFNYILSRSSIIKKGSPIMVGVPKEYPSDMVSELKMYFTTIKIVKAAYLLWTVKGEETSYLLVIDCCGNTEEEFHKIADICRPFLKGKLLDMISFNTSFAKDVVKNQKPFYQV